MRAVSGSRTRRAPPTVMWREECILGDNRFRMTGEQWLIIACGEVIDVTNHSRYIWEAKWWTQGEQPPATSSGVWIDKGAC